MPSICPRKSESDKCSSHPSREDTRNVCSSEDEEVKLVTSNTKNIENTWFQINLGFIGIAGQQTNHVCPQNNSTQFYFTKSPPAEPDVIHKKSDKFNIPPLLPPN